jgi:Zn-dependent peptidase ImmA (M78 family)/transcriptional regulator with XRE-family HTH domain/predicted HTH domain antitoxin
MSLAERLVEARDLARFMQADVAAALGVSRTMLSYWESGARRPNDRQLVALSRLYRVEVARLLGDEPLEDAKTAARMMFRGAEQELPAAAMRGLREFEAFLDTYARLAEQLDFQIHGLTQSPFAMGGGYDTAEDARRKAEEVRAHLRLGLGPIGDVDRVCELLGVTALRVPLGDDLSQTISGAFFAHPEVGFSVLINLQMTPGRRRFTAAHELAHALFHSNARYVLSFARKDPRERFADVFAGEFLMPSEGIRRMMEEHDLGPRIVDPTEVVHLQRYFNVSFATALVRLRQARFLTAERYEEFKSVRPVLFARALGYEIDQEELEQDGEQWRLRRYPPRFLRLLRLAIQEEKISIPTAAELVGISIDEMADFADTRALAPDVASLQRRETAEFEQTNVLV